MRIDWKDGRYWAIKIVKEQGKWCWQIKTGSKFSEYTKKDGTIEMHRQCTGTNTISINRFPYWIHRIKWRAIQLWYHIRIWETRLCEGCGEGIAIYRIRDPNQGHGNERFNCCKDCVTFYDWRWSAMDIVGWKFDLKKVEWIPICKKGSRCIEAKGGRKR